MTWMQTQRIPQQPTNPPEAFASSDAFRLALEALYVEHKRQLEEMRSTLLHESARKPAPKEASISLGSSQLDCHLSAPREASQHVCQTTPEIIAVSTSGPATSQPFRESTTELCSNRDFFVEEKSALKDFVRDLQIKYGDDGPWNERQITPMSNVFNSVFGNSKSIKRDLPY